MKFKIQTLFSVLMFDAAYPPPILGGKEKQAHLLAKQLSKIGIECNAISYKHNGNSSGVHEDIIVDRVSTGIWAIPSLFLKLIAHRRIFKILHIHTPSRIGKVMVILGFLLRYRIIFKFPNEHLLDSRGFIDRAVWRVLFRLIDLLVVLEEDTVNKLLDRRIDKRKIFFVVNGVEIGQFVDVSENNQQQIKLIFVGRLMPQKACDSLINACAILQRKGIDFSLKIVGDGPLKEKLVKMVYNLNLNKHVDFEGYNANPLTYMKMSDVVVLPSLNEGMSNVLLEAISIGLPIVATDVGSARKQVGPFGEQFLCRSNDPKSLAEKILILAKDSSLRAEYGNYLYRRGKELFSIEAVAKKYIEKYNQILGK